MHKVAVGVAQAALKAAVKERKAAEMKLEQLEPQALAAARTEFLEDRDRVFAEAAAMKAAGSEAMAAGERLMLAASNAQRKMDERERKLQQRERSLQDDRVKMEASLGAALMAFDEEKSIWHGIAAELKASKATVEAKAREATQQEESNAAGLLKSSEMLTAELRNCKAAEAKRAASSGTTARSRDLRERSKDEEIAAIRKTIWELRGQLQSKSALADIRTCPGRFPGVHTEAEPLRGALSHSDGHTAAGADQRQRVCATHRTHSGAYLRCSR